MARRKQYAAPKKRMLNLAKDILPGVAVGIIEPFADQLAAQLNLNVSDDIVKLGAGVATTYFGTGIVRDVGKALTTIATRNLTQQAMSGMNPLQKSSTATATTNGNQYVLA